MRGTWESSDGPGTVAVTVFGAIAAAVMLSAVLAVIWWLVMAAVFVLGGLAVTLIVMRRAVRRGEAELAGQLDRSRARAAVEASGAADAGGSHFHLHLHGDVISEQALREIAAAMEPRDRTDS